MILIIRLLPFLVGLLEAGLFWWQGSLPGTYPLLVVAGVILLPLASGVIAWKQVRLGDLVEKMAPAFLLLAVLGFALLLSEGWWPRLLITALAVVFSFLSLELLFLLARDPGSYPVNGLSHLSLATVPLAVWYGVSTSAGLLVFLHSDGVWHVALCAVLGVVLFRTTGHPGATRQQNNIWLIIGGILGTEIGLLGLLLPVSLPAQGLIAALLFCSVLRVRRYLYEPRPSRKVAWTEGLLALLSLIVTLASAKWL